jgi:proton-dependent oligopeptide transporter, POT family
MTTSAEFEAPPQKVTGHPRGLYVLFFSEAWERFSYYGMRALLVLYLTKHLNYARKDALLLYATYTGLVYLTPLLGGFLADKLLGQRKAILIGGTVMAMGHFAMAFESMLHVALCLLMLGNGFFKPNISTMVGNLYPQGDARRDGAYTIFYMGINLGAFLSPLVCGSLGENPRFGWHYGFGAAGVGMVFGLISFMAFQHQLVGGFPPGREEAGPARLTVLDGFHVILGSLICVGVAYAAGLGLPAFLPYSKVVVPTIAGLFGLSMLIVFARAMMTMGTKEGEDWQRISVILIVSLFSIVFWMGFEQAGGTLNLFADAKTDRTLFDLEFPASYFQSINPLLIISLAPLFSMLWSAIDNSRFRLTSSAKMGFGLILLGLGFIVMYQAERATEAGGKVGPQWLACVYLLFTMGELCLSPIGLSLVNKLAPAKMASLLMATWFLCTAIANFFAGTLEEILSHFHINLWLFLIATSIIPGLMLLALTVPLKKMAHGRL